MGIDSRAGSDGIRLGKYDSISEQYILPNVVPMVLAQHHPTITAVFPHRSNLQAVTSVGWTFSGANERKSPGISDFNSVSTQHHTPAARSRQSQVALAAGVLPGTLTLISPTVHFFLRLGGTSRSPLPLAYSHLTECRIQSEVVASFMQLNRTIVTL